MANDSMRWYRSMIRKWRRKAGPDAGNAIELGVQIGDTIDRYQAQCPDLTYQQVYAALENCRFIVAESEAKANNPLEHSAEQSE